MIPIADENPTALKPVVNVTLIVLNLTVFFYSVLLGPDGFAELVYSYGTVPAFILSGKRLYTLITSMFLHGGWAHIIGNMVYLWIFGDNIEDACGHVKYLLFYILCGVIASLTHIAANPNSLVPAVGASGAISGVLGAYLLLYPRANVLTIIPWGYFFYRIIRIPALIYIGFWFVFQVIAGSITLLYGVKVGAAYFAHIGGFIAGILLAKAMNLRPRTMAFMPRWVYMRRYYS